MRRAPRLAAALAVLIAAPLGAVGFGPLSDSGVIDGPSRGFSLTLLNPYKQTEAFRVYAVGPGNDETPQARVAVFPAEATLGSGLSRRVIAVANDLAVGEDYHFRVCAELARPPAGVMINARVCSKLSARRVQ